MLGREVAQRVRDVPGVEAAGRHLIEQRLEGVVRELVEQGNPEPSLASSSVADTPPKPAPTTTT